MTVTSKHCKSRSEIIPWSASIKLVAVRSHCIITPEQPFLEQPVVAELDTMFPIFCRKWLFIAVFEGPNNWTLYRDRCLCHSHTLFKTILKRFIVVFQSKHKLCSTDKTLSFIVYDYLIRAAARKYEMKVPRRRAGDAHTSCEGHSSSICQAEHMYCVVRCQMFFLPFAAHVKDEHENRKSRYLWCATGDTIFKVHPAEIRR